MKKTVVLCLVWLLAACNRAYEFPSDITGNAIAENDQVVYSLSTESWNRSKMNNDEIVFTKHISVGSGSYSEYLSDTQNLHLASTYEFLRDGRLIGYSDHELKFYEVVRRDGKFKQVELSPAEVGELFPGLDIVRLSEADGKTLTVNRLPFGKKTFLLLNDTPVSYYHYSFEKLSGNKPFKSVLTVDKAGDVFFSHFGADDAINPKLTVRVINGI